MSMYSKYKMEVYTESFDQSDLLEYIWARKRCVHDSKIKFYDFVFWDFILIITEMEYQSDLELKS